MFLVAVPAFLLTMLLEWRMLVGRRDLAGYDGADTASSMSMGLGFLALHAGWSLVYLAFFAVAHRSFAIFDLRPVWWSWALLLVLDDLTFYVFHRAGHEIRLMWAAHHTHHSSTRYNLSTALRQSWWEQLFTPLFWLWLPILGFPVEMLVVQASVSLLYQYWLHTELLGDLGPLGLVFNSPRAHAVHHGRNPRYLDRNYGGILIVWDRLFGTYEPLSEPVDYGTLTPLGSHNPLWVAFAEPLAMLRDVGRARSWRARWMAVFGPPGWTDDGVDRTARGMRTAALTASVPPPPVPR
ncbi:MAG: sterol desaturase family protein [Alphaproteobacteria bacterium]|nr:sterol desaturase family protein [Alphaproteobacteria bacterium]